DFANIYLTGYSSSSSSIASPGAYQTTHGGGHDAMLIKMDSSGSRVWATYYGGAASDVGYNVAVNAVGDIFITGQTSSASGISLPGAEQIAVAGAEDGFVAKFDASGM